jgi:5,10-methenyltetrahydrofolate synthetase
VSDKAVSDKAVADKDDEEHSQYASPPCFMHELGPDGVQAVLKADGWADVARWRKAERQRLIDTRLALSVQEREVRSQRIAEGLDRVIGAPAGRTVSIYWPFRGEHDLRKWANTVIARGGRIALPVVVQKGHPLEFRHWAPGDPMERGVWNILVPARGPAVLPDVVIAPLVGYDDQRYRLGYGGGFFDRTLAAMPRKPLVVGIGYAESRLATIYPQPHDIPMDRIVTDEATGS